MYKKLQRIELLYTPQKHFWFINYNEFCKIFTISIIATPLHFWKRLKIFAAYYFVKSDEIRHYIHTVLIASVQR